MAKSNSFSLDQEFANGLDFPLEDYKDLLSFFQRCYILSPFIEGSDHTTRDHLICKVMTLLHTLERIDKFAKERRERRDQSYH